MAPVKKTRYPLSSFDPRFKRVWLEALLHPVEFTFSSWKEANTFQTRLHIFRARSRDSGDPDAKLMYRARTSRKGPHLTIRLSDAEFDTALTSIAGASGEWPSATAEKTVPPASPESHPTSEPRRISVPPPSPERQISLTELFEGFQPSSNEGETNGQV